MSERSVLDIIDIIDIINLGLDIAIFSMGFWLGRMPRV